MSVAIGQPGVNHALPMVVDGEPAIQWITDRFYGAPTTANCGQF